MKWDSALYDKKHAFVFNYGEDLIELLGPKPGEHILDVGCGTGHLTKQISDRGAIITGFDSSADMIDKARASYPEINFHVMDGKLSLSQNDLTRFSQTQYYTGYLKLNL